MQREKKFKQDLEAREDAAKTEKESDEIAAKNLEAEINRLREEGSKLLKEQQELLRDQLKKEVECDKDSKIYQDVTPKLKVRWKSKKSDLTNGGYTQEMIRSLFEKYGEVSYVIVSSNKKGSAVAEFTSMASAKLAVENEHGIPDNPLQISWLDGEPSSNDASSETDPGVSKSTRDVGEATDKYMVSEEFYQSDGNISERDYESVVLMKLRQFEERKRLIREMEEEEKR